MSPLAPGLHVGVNRSFYEVDDGINVSILAHFERSAEQAHKEMTHPSEPTRALEVGQAYHCAVLEPEDFAVLYAPPPEGVTDRRTKEGKANWLHWEEEHPQATELSSDEWATVTGMRERLFSDPVSAAILGGVGKNETTLVWQDEATGLRCKGRIDRICQWDDGTGPWTWIVDLKSCEDARPHAVRGDVKKRLYGPRLAWYHHGCNVLAPAERRALWLFQEKKPPYDFMLYEATPDALAAGRQKCEKWLWLYKDAVERGVWDSYPREVQQLDAKEMTYGS